MAKFEGGGVEALLTSIDHDKPVKLWNEKLKVAATVPAGWFHYASSSANDEASGEFRLIAPDKFLAASVKVRKKTLLSSDERESPDAWADSLIQTSKDAFKNSNVRKDSRKAVQFAGADGVTLAIDYKATGRNRTSAAALAFKGELAIEVEVSCEADVYNKSVNTFDEIRKSVTVD